MYERLALALKDERTIRLSFQRVTILTPTFLNAAIGQLYGVFSENKIRFLLEVQDIQSDDLVLLKRVVDAAKQYFKNPGKFAQTVRNILENPDQEDELVKNFNQFPLGMYPSNLKSLPLAHPVYRSFDAEKVIKQVLGIEGKPTFSLNIIDKHRALAIPSDRADQHENEIIIQPHQAKEKLSSKNVNPILALSCSTELVKEYRFAFIFNCCSVVIIKKISIKKLLLVQKIKMIKTLYFTLIILII